MLRTRLKLLVGGCLVSLVFLELLIRGIGGLVRYQTLVRNRTAGKSEVRILVLGESTTYMGGSLSWPSQLQGLLQKANPNARISVINGAAPGINSSYLLEHLDEEVATYHPQVVITMMGANDNGASIPFTGLDQPELSPWLRNWRLYRLVAYVRASLHPPPIPTQQMPVMRRAEGPEGHDPLAERAMSAAYQEARTHYNDPDMKQVIPYLQAAIAADPTDPRPYLDLAERLKITEQSPDATLEVLGKVVALCPQDAVGYVAMGAVEIRPNHKDQALAYYRQAVGRNYLSLANYPHLVNRFARFLEVYKYDDEAERFFDVMIRHAPESGFLGLAYAHWMARGRADKAERYASQLRAKEEDYYIPQTRLHFLRLYEKSHQYGFQLVCAQYAGRSLRPLQIFLAGKDDVIFVSNEEPFRTLLRAGRYDDLFTDKCNGDFGHGTALGNFYLAHNVAERLLSMGFGNPQALSSVPLY